MVEEIMTRDVVCGPGDLAGENAAAIMREKHIRRLLVLDADNKPVGLLWLDELEARQPAE
jgi:CBS domain-containing protein